MVYAKYVSTPIHPVEFPQKNQFPNKPGFPLSALIILDWSNVDLLLSKKKRAEKIESWSIEFAWQFQSVLPSPVEIGRN